MSASVSLVVATLNRKDELAVLLESLEKQTFQDFEVIVVDQNKEGVIDHIIKKYSLSPFALIHIRVPPTGVSNARNAGIALAKGQFIAFPDDDCFYEKDTLENVVMFFNANPSCSVVLGDWLPPGKTFSDGLAPVAVTLYSAFKKGETFVQFFRECNGKFFSFDPVIGPGTGLPYWSGEDSDYLLQFLREGCSVTRVLSVHIRHPEQDVTGMNLKKVFYYGVGRMYVLKKHKLPLWFGLANVIYPLARIPFESPGRWFSRIVMFAGRASGLFWPNQTR